MSEVSKNPKNFKEKDLAKKDWLPILIISMAVFVIALDSTFMNVAIKYIIVDLTTNVATIQIIITFYTLIMASLMLLGGKLQDIVGKKKLFIIGAILYGIGTFIASISVNSTMLFIGWSCIEGLGAALMTPATLAIIGGSYTGKDRTMALAIITAMGGIAAAIGPLFGGFLTEFASWRWGFAIELIVIFVILIFHKKIKYFEPIMFKKDLDKLGAVISALGLILVILGVLLLSNKDFSFVVPYLLVSGIITLVIFYIYEKKLIKNNKMPIFDVNLLKIRNFVIGSSTRLLTNLVLAGTIFSISLYLQTVIKSSPFQTGLVLMAMTTGLLVLSFVAPKLIKWLSHKQVISIGLIMGIIGTIMLSNKFGLSTGLWDIVPGMLILGGGLGLSIPLTADIVLNAVETRKQSDASGFMSTSTNFGSSMGTAIIGTIMIIGAISGFYTGVDEMYPGVISFDEAESYFQSMRTGGISDAVLEKPEFQNIFDETVFSAMKYAMLALSAVLGLALVLTLTMKPIKPNF
ncbi:MAG: MFS transporter [Methanobacteriaceae archaeon]